MRTMQSKKGPTRMYLIPRLHVSVHGLGMRHPGCDGAELTCVSEPSLLVKAASLKHTMQTAFSLMTLSALGTRSRIVPNGCVYVCVRGCEGVCVCKGVRVCLLVSSLMLRNKQTNKQMVWQNKVRQLRSRRV